MIPVDFFSQLNDEVVNEALFDADHGFDAFSSVFMSMIKESTSRDAGQFLAEFFDLFKIEKKSDTRTVVEFNPQDVKLATAKLLKNLVVDAHATTHNMLSVVGNVQAKHATKIASDMAHARYSKDPKQAAKSEIKALWLEWQVKPHLYKSKAEFAREMQKRHKDDESEALIKDTKTISDTWIKEWKSEQNTTPVCTA